MPGPAPEAARQVRIDRFGPPAVVHVAPVVVGLPGPGQVRVRVLASTVSGTDAVVRKGLYPLLRDSPPLTLGFDLVGTVDAVGEGVAVPAIGDRVAALTPGVGGNAELAIVPAETALPVPADVDPHRLAALTLGYLTAYQMLQHHLRVEAGQRILVHGGSGAVGTAAIQLARLCGAEVVATASPGKLDHLARHGAEPISYRDPDLWARLHAATVVDGRQGFDGVLDPVGSGSVGRSLRLLAPGGTVAAYSTVAAAMRIPVRTPASFTAFGAGYAALQARLAMSRAMPGSRRAVFFGSRDSARDHPRRHREDLEELCRLLVLGRIDPWLPPGRWRRPAPSTRRTMPGRSVARPC